MLVFALAAGGCSNQLAGDRGPDAGVRDRGQGDGGFVDIDGKDDSDDGSEQNAGEEAVAELAITLDAQIEVGQQVTAELLALSSSGDMVALGADEGPAWSSSAPGIATVAGSDASPTIEGVAPGSAEITVDVGELSTMVAIEVLAFESVVRVSYHGEPCPDFAVPEKDVWACAIVGEEQPDYKGEYVLQVCREGAWVNTGVMTEDECKSCGDEGIETEPGKVCSGAPACAIDLYCGD